MSTSPIRGPIQTANKTAAEWSAQNPVLLAGQLGLETDTRLLKAGDGVNGWNALAYTASSASVTIKTVNNTSLVGAGDLSTTVVDVAYTTAIPLDSQIGKRMPRTIIGTNTAWTVGPGPTNGGACEVVVVGDGTHTLTVPSDWTLISGSSVPVLTAGTRSVVAMFYVDSSVLWSVTPMSNIDTTPPTLVSATVPDTDPLRINLVWSEPMVSAVSAPSAFAVSSGHAITVHTYDTSTTSHLTITTAFVQGETKTLAYTAPGVNPMQDLAGNLLVNFAGTAITDSVTNPTLVSAVVPDTDALRINLTWSEAMNSTVSAASAFAISAGHGVTSHTYDTATTSHLVITTAFVQGETKTLAYTQPGVNNMMDAAGGNLVANFSGAAITDSVTSPTLLSAVVSGGTATKIDLTWSEAMNSTVSAATSFAVSSGHALTSHVYVDATHTQLTTSTAFVAAETKTLAYTPSGTNDMKDVAGGNLAAAFSGKAITDNVGSGATLVQTSGEKTVDNLADSGGTTTTFTAPGNFTAGNTVIICASMFNSFGNDMGSVTVSGTAAVRDTFIRAIDNASYSFAIYRATNVIGGNADVVFTYGQTGSSNYITCSFEEWTGFNASPTDSIPTPVQTTGTSQSISSASTAQNNEVVYAMAGVTRANGAGFAGPTTGYTQTALDTAAGTHLPIAAGYKILTSTGVQTAGWTTTGSVEDNALMVTYKTS